MSTAISKSSEPCVEPRKLATHRMSLNDYLQQQAASGISEELTEIVTALAEASLDIADRVRLSVFDAPSTAGGSINVQGEVQKQLDVVANDIVLDACRVLPQVSFAVSEELDDAVRNSELGRYAVVFDPLDGSSNLDVNISVGSIFSIIRAREYTELLQPGSRQRFAGYVGYGPTTIFTFTFGGNVAMFAVDDERCYRLVSDEVKIPPRFAEYSINSSRKWEWPTAVARFIQDCELGDEGPLGCRYNMRWVGSMVAELHRIMLRGGVFLYPNSDNGKNGKLRLLYEANPMSLIYEAAGGAAWTGAERILDMQPTSLHQRTGVIIGSADEVTRVKRYFADG